MSLGDEAKRSSNPLPPASHHNIGSLYFMQGCSYGVCPFRQIVALIVVDHHRQIFRVWGRLQRGSEKVFHEISKRTQRLSRYINTVLREALEHEFFTNLIWRALNAHQKLLLTIEWICFVYMACCSAAEDVLSPAPDYRFTGSTTGITGSTKPFIPLGR